MHGMLEIPEGFKVPVKNEGEMFTVPVEFTIMNGMLLPIAVDGIDLPAPQEEGEMEGEEGMGPDGSMRHEAPEGEVCSECGESEENCGCDSEGMGKGKMGGGGEGGGFMIAIEKAMGKGKR
jgi:hypothetical protein